MPMVSSANVPSAWGRLIGSMVGLAAFAIMILRGLHVGNPGDVILKRALVGLLIATTLAGVVGHLARRILIENTDNDGAGTHEAADSVPPSEPM